MKASKQWRIPLLVAGFALIATACGGGDEVVTTTQAPVPSGEIAVTATDYEYDGIPARVKVGSSFVLDNESDVELHEIVAIRLDDAETRSVEEILALPPDQSPLGPPSAVVLAPPGGAPSFAVVGTGALDEPGRYAIICAIPTDADPALYLELAATSEGPPQVDGGPPHFTAGMWAEVVVEE